MQKPKQPLYRKVNTTAHGIHHRFGGEFNAVRRRAKSEEPDRTTLAMHHGAQRGLDYTPLFRFLLSRVGQRWNEVYSEAVSRLDRKEPIFWMVAVQTAKPQAYIRTGESSYFSGLKVDEEGVLRVVDPSIGPSSLVPFCRCCTHTFNGTPFTRTHDPETAALVSATRLS